MFDELLESYHFREFVFKNDATDGRDENSNYARYDDSAEYGMSVNEFWDLHDDLGGQDVRNYWKTQTEQEKREILARYLSKCIVERKRWENEEKIVKNLLTKV